MIVFIFTNFIDSQDISDGSERKWLWLPAENGEVCPYIVSVFENFKRDFRSSCESTRDKPRPFHLLQVESEFHIVRFSFRSISSLEKLKSILSEFRELLVELFYIKIDFRLSILIYLFKIFC